MALEREQPHRPRAPTSGASSGATGRPSTSASTWHHCAERAAPPTNATSVDRVAGERLHVREQPREVVRDALDDRAHQVGPAGLERHVHEAAAHRPARGRRERSTEPGEEQHAARARLRSRRTPRRAPRTGRHAVVGEVVVGVHHAFEHVLEHLAAQTVLRAHDVAVDVRARASRGSGARGRCGSRRPRRRARSWCRSRGRPGRCERARRDRDRGGVVGRRVHDDRLREPEQLRHGGQERADGCVDRHERGEARRVDAGELHELVVVGGRAERAVVAELHHERRVLRRGDAPGEARGHVVHRLDVRGRRRVHVGLGRVAGRGCGPTRGRCRSAGCRGARGTS